VRGPLGEERVRFLIDSGITYSLLPEPVWKKIGLVPKREHTFVVADDRTINRKVSDCYILPEGEGHTPLILGEEGDEALLGVVTLEILGLVFVQARPRAHADASHLDPGFTGLSDRI